MGQNTDYIITSTSKFNKLKKTEGFQKIYITVKNLSDKTWWDGINASARTKSFVKIEPALDGTLSTRYFELLSAGRYKKEKMFFKILSKDANQHSVEPGQSVVITVYIKVKDYTPLGKHAAVIVLRDRDTKKKLNPNPTTQKVKLKVEAGNYHDARMAKLVNIGDVDFTHKNAAFDSLNNDKNQQAVIMAVWSRVERLPITFESLLKQKNTAPVLYLWVNNRTEDEKIKKLITESPLPIKAYFSNSNIGGFGRFYLARRISEKHDTVVFIDDDQVPAQNAIKVMADSHKPKTIEGVYATRTPSPDDYWIRDEINPGESADYIGTCGMMCDTSIFEDERLYKCPRKYWFIEDLWLCYFASTELGYDLIKSGAQIVTIEDQKDQFRPMIDLKNEFYKYLLRHGLKIHQRDIV